VPGALTTHPRSFDGSARLRYDQLAWPVAVSIPSRSGSPGTARHGLFTHLLPYLEGKTIYDGCNLGGNTFNDPQRYAPVAVYACPSYRGEPIIRGNANDY
jgi:hypothetical protein